MAKRAKKSQPAAPVLDYIHESLRHLAVPIEELVPDPANARKHGEKNLASIRGSLAQFGQRRPAVVQVQGMIVRAGNGMLEAARQLGWTHLACLQVDDDDVKAISYAIADNRTAELADWDKDVLEQLLGEVEVGDENLQEMFAALAEDLDIVVAGDADEADSPPPAELPDKYQVLVTCADETAQKELLERLSQEGFECRALIA